jgi:hypothetical protein
MFNDTPSDDQYETADFPLSELALRPPVLAALSEAGYDTFLQIIDLERRDFLGIEGIGEEDADRLLQLIDELTVVEGEVPVAEEEAAEGEGDTGGDGGDGDEAAEPDSEDDGASDE